MKRHTMFVVRARWCSVLAVLVFATTALAYVLILDRTLPGVTIKWHVSEIKYYLNPSGAGLPAAQTIAAVQNAYAAWSRATSSLSFRYMGTTTAKNDSNDGQNTVFWDTARSFAPSGSLAVTKLTWDSSGSISDADIGFATNTGSSTVTPPSGTSCSGTGIRFGGLPIVWAIEIGRAHV